LHPLSIYRQVIGSLILEPDVLQVGYALALEMHAPSELLQRSNSSFSYSV